MFWITDITLSLKIADRLVMIITISTNAVLGVTFLYIPNDNLEDPRPHLKSPRTLQQVQRHWMLHQVTFALKQSKKKHSSIICHYFSTPQVIWNLWEEPLFRSCKTWDANPTMLFCQQLLSCSRLHSSRREVLILPISKHLLPWRLGNQGNTN